MSDVLADQDFSIECVLDALRRVLPERDRPIELHEPLFGEPERSAQLACIDSGWVSYGGPDVAAFERRLAEVTGVAEAVAVVSGTAALHMCLLAVGVRQGDEVLVPALTFVASVNPIAYCGAIPHFVDSAPETLGVDPARLDAYLERIAELGADGCINRATGRRIRALVAVHTFGHPADLDGINAVCQRWNLELVEDAAESLGSSYRGRHTGGFGRVAALSFNGNKIVTTGGGGALLTNDRELAAEVRHLTTTAKQPHRWEFIHDRIAFNYRMPNLNAALGRAQLDRLPTFLTAKRALAARYAAAFNGVPGVSVVREPAHGVSNYWLNAILLAPGLEEWKNVLLERTHAMGIKTRPAWRPIHRLDMYREAPRMNLRVTESVYARLVNVPSSAFL